MTEGVETMEDEPQAVLRRKFVLLLIGLLIVPSSAGAMAGFFLGGFYWLFDLFNHLWFHYAILFLIALPLLALLRSKRLLLISALMLGVSVWQVWPYLPSLPEQESEVPTSMPTPVDLKLLQFNVNTQGGSPVAVAGYIAEQDADVVFLQEVNQRWLDALDGQVGDYELVIASARTDHFGIACYIRTGQERVVVNSSQIVDQTNGLAAVPAIELELEVESWLGKRTVPVLSLHTLPPVSGKYARARDAQLAAAGNWASQAGDHAVVIGDLNATPWSKPFKAMLEVGDLTNSQIGYGRHSTWPSGLPAVMGIPIDHCLHGRGLTTENRQVGESCGSDHKAVQISLNFRGC